jgi:DNA-binding MarR family transcriptional regulator
VIITTCDDHWACEDLEMSKPALAERPSFLLSQVGAFVADRFAARLAPFGLTPRQFGVLTIVSGGAPLSQQQLGEMLGIHRNSMVLLLDALEAEGLLERTRQSDDRRAHALTVTATGRDALRRAQKALNDVEDEIFGGLSDPERATLTRLLRSVVRHNELLQGVHPGLQKG